MSNKIIRIQDKCGFFRHIGIIITMAIAFNLSLYVLSILGSPIADSFLSLYEEFGYKFLILQFIHTLISSSIIYGVYRFRNIFNQ